MTLHGKCLRLFVVSITVIAAMTFVSDDSIAKGTPPETVSFVDIESYLGTWYEIAAIPNRFQKHCHGNTMAIYQHADQHRIKVINSCLESDGQIDRAEGVARIVDPASNAKLEVSFVSLFGWQLFWGDYWILDLAPDYSYVIVGTPDYRYGWLLSRTPVVSDELRNYLDERLRALGYDPAAFVDTPQGIK
jgi:apolipoprotein D and lipocalin family protein